MKIQINQGHVPQNVPHLSVIYAQKAVRGDGSLVGVTRRDQFKLKPALA